jgi:hypothetical protein
MEKNEIISSLQRALENVEKASKAKEKEDEIKLDLSLWRAFSEIEYISLLNSLETGEKESVYTKRKRVNRIDLGSSLIDARDSLLESLKLVETDEFSIRVDDEIEKAKTSVFDAIRKQSAINRRNKKSGKINRAPSSDAS